MKNSAVDKNGNPKQTEADNNAYELILKDKERLLDDSEPLRFIFSHSALGVGWDNPNVFNICTLNDTTSEIKKRQEIGRGLRLPVNKNGERIQDGNINILTVIANESYEEFSRKLQTEIEQDTGVKFDGRIKEKCTRKKIKLNKALILSDEFKAIWDKIKHKTKYSVSVESQQLIDKTVELLQNVLITAPKILTTKTALQITEKGVEGVHKSSRGQQFNEQIYVPDVLGEISERTKVTRDTVLTILQSENLESGNFYKKIIVNPQMLVDEVSHAITIAHERLMVDGVKYEKTGNVFEMKLFENQELDAYLYDEFSKRGAVATASQADDTQNSKTLWDYTVVDSEIEHNFLKDMESSEQVKFYCKLPFWFKVPTPVGNYNPDWAVVFDGGKRIYFVAETKGVNSINAQSGLSQIEVSHIKAGIRHFEALGVDYIAPTNSWNDTAGKAVSKVVSDE